MHASSSLPAWLAQGIAALAAGQTQAWADLYTEDAVHEFPYAPEDHPRRLEGREAIAAFMAPLPGLIRFGHLDPIRSREVGDEIIVEARGHHHRVSDGMAVKIDYVWFITLREGKISHFRDYMNPLQLARLQAFAMARRYKKGP